MYFKNYQEKAEYITDQFFNFERKYTMKLIKITATPKEYNGSFYTEFTFQLRDGNINRIVKTTGKTEVVLLDPDTGEEISTGYLNNYDIKMIPYGCNLEFWFDMMGKISRIDVHCPANIAGSDISIS